MAKWELLPPELVAEVLLGLDVRDLKATSLVFSQLREPSQRLLFEGVVITDDSRETPPSNEVVGMSSDQTEYGLLEFMKFFHTRGGLFTNVKSLKVHVPHPNYDDINTSGWLSDWNQYYDAQFNPTSPKSSDPEIKKSSSSTNQKLPSIIKLDDKLSQAASSFGIPNALLTTFPLSAAFLALVHSLPKIKILNISDARVTLTTLTLATYGHKVVGPTPACLRQVTSLGLAQEEYATINDDLSEDEQHLWDEEVEYRKSWQESPLPLLCGLPKLSKLNTRGWGANKTVGSVELSSLGFLFYEGEVNPDDPKSSPSLPLASLTHLAFHGATIAIEAIAGIVSYIPDSTLEEFQYHQRLFNNKEYIDTDAHFWNPNFFENFKCDILLGADDDGWRRGLKRHTSSLRTLKITWKEWDGWEEDFEEPLFHTDTFGTKLRSFTALKHLVVPAHMLFGSKETGGAEDIGDEDLETIFSSRLPSSLETLEIGLHYLWRVDKFLEETDIVEDWPVVKTKVFPELTSLTLTRQSNDDPSSFTKSMASLEMVGIRLVILPL